jgi:hypothetical protein
MLQITKKQWEAIPADYKGIWERWVKDNGWQPDLPEEYIGKRTLLDYNNNSGTVLLTEGMHFIIVD